jgi:hypothetical protein
LFSALIVDIDDSINDEIKQCSDDSMQNVQSITVMHHHRQQFDRIRWRNTALISPMNFSSDDGYGQHQPTITIKVVYLICCK